MIKALIVIVMLGILYTLASSFFFLIRDQGKGPHVVRRLSWRIAISVVLFIAIIVAMKLGYVTPSGINPVQYPAG